MTHLWVRAETRANEARVAVMPDGIRALIEAGFQITVEDSPERCIATPDYAAAGASIADAGAWRAAPENAIILGLKELPEEGSPLKHHHIMFGHAYKGQPAGQVLLDRFKAGGGTLLDLEYLTDDAGKRVAAFGYWAGYAGAAVSLLTWAAQERGEVLGPVGAYPSAQALLAALQAELSGLYTRPNALIIGARGRVGSGAGDLCTHMGVATTLWDIEETALGGPFPEVLAYNLFLNCILARPGTPVFVPVNAKTAHRALSVIGDIACDPDSDFSPIKVYDSVTSWSEPSRRVHETPPLDVMAIDNLPSMMPRDSSEDFAQQLLPSLAKLITMSGEWARAKAMFDRAMTDRD